jgi:predicted glycogen debranching enzyme
MDSVAVETLGFEGLIGREWLQANGLGGYASSTICGMNTRKYHGMLVAAMTPPVRRMVILSHIEERVIVGNSVAELSCNEYPDTIHPRGDQLLRAFSAHPFPRWAYQSDGFTIEKSLRLLEGENAVCVAYTLLAGESAVDLELRPLLALRPIHELMYQWNGRLRADCRENGRVRIGATSRTPEVFLSHDGEFAEEPVWYLNTIYRREQERGYAGLEDLWTPGVVRRRLAPGQTLHLACSMEKVDLDRVISLAHRPPVGVMVDPAAGEELAHLTEAARPYVVNINSEATANRTTSIITHYPWSSPSVRGAMISMAGLLLVPGRFEEAKSLLQSTAALADAGVLPSELPEDGSQPVYHGADVSLWFINAIGQYWTYTEDEKTVAGLLNVLDEIIEHYRRGTHLGIAADADGLIVTRAVGIPTTWMDASLIDWVVTPRRGRPVEINALWHNALRLVADFHRRLGRPERSRQINMLADSAQRAFNQRFWNPELNCLYDVVDDKAIDGSVRPNQLFAVSLPHPVVWRERQAAVVDAVMNDLLIPYGVRTLSPRDPAYKARYQGNVVLRDSAYFQGTAFPWLLGPLVTAMLRVRGRTEQSLHLARRILRPAITWMEGEGMGLMCELFDGDSPHRPGGALASAPAAGELLRAWAEDVLAIAPPRRGAPESPATSSPVGAVR